MKQASKEMKNKADSFSGGVAGPIQNPTKPHSKPHSLPSILSLIFPLWATPVEMNSRRQVALPYVFGWEKGTLLAKSRFNSQNG